MSLDELNLSQGTWLAANCGAIPSETNCQLVIMAPEDQREDLIAAATTHAINKHGHLDSEELLEGVGSSIEVIEIP